MIHDKYSMHLHFGMMLTASFDDASMLFWRCFFVILVVVLLLYNNAHNKQKQIIFLKTKCKILKMHKQMLANFLVDLKSVKRLQMHWRDSKNKVDCAVYVMRHKEIFMGEN